MPDLSPNPAPSPEPGPATGRLTRHKHPEAGGKGPVSVAGFGQGFMSGLHYPIGLSRQLRRGQVLRIELMGHAIALARGQNGTAFALQDSCPHRAALLSQGRVVAESDGSYSLQCPYHGWRFGPKGQCRFIPALAHQGGDDVNRPQTHHYDILERDSILWLAMADMPVSQQAIAAPPHLPALCVRRPKVVASRVFDAHIDHVCAGLVDPAHTPFVHKQWFWRAPDRLLVKTKHFVPGELGFTMVAHRPSANSWIYSLLGGKPQTTIRYSLPGIRYEHIEAGRLEFLAGSFLYPISATQTRFTQILWWRGLVLDLLTPFFIEATRIFLDQDAKILQAQSMGLATHPHRLLTMGDPDMPAKWLWDLKREWIASRAENRSFCNPVHETHLSWTT